MATYNGEKYIEEQINSIVSQISDGDEIVISDDGSSDKTREIIAKFSKEYNIRVFENTEKGVITNFENAIKNTINEIIFLCDQDDVWAKDKVSTITSLFRDNKLDLVLSDAIVVDEKLQLLFDSNFKLVGSNTGVIKNIFRNSYMGCCMAFRENLKDIILPFPKNIPMHDNWIGILAELNGKVSWTPKKLVYYRRHKNTITGLKRKSIITRLIWRKNLVLQLLKRQLEVKWLRGFTARKIEIKKKKGKT